MWELTIVKNRVFSDGFKCEDTVKFKSKDINDLLFMVKEMAKMDSEVIRYEIKEVEEA